jgi:DNA-nicking Smr family endonuclease
MPKKTKISTSVSKEDIAAFREAVKGAKLHVNEKVRLSAPDIRRKASSRSLEFNEESFNFNESLDLDPVQGEEYIVFKQTGISNKILRKLRKGKYNVDAILDLHGMSVDEAIAAVDGFLQQCLHKGTRVVLIIHGKGHHSQMPILKNKLNHWLREINAVLAFCSAAPAHGSRGAIYVLLKRNSEEILLG